MLASVVVVVIASVGPALMRRSQAGVPQRFSPNDLELEIKTLAGRLYLSPAEKQFFERRAAEDELEAKRIKQRAERLTWTRYWRTRPRRKRFLVLGSLALGACVGGALAWLSGCPLLLATMPSGAGFLIALEASRRYRRRDGQFRGSLLMEAAAEVSEYLVRLETVPNLDADPRRSFWRDLAFLPRGRWHN